MANTELNPNLLYLRCKAGFTSRLSFTEVRRFKDLPY